MPDDDFDGRRMLESELDLYHEKLDQAERDNPNVTIRRSLEIDYLPGYEEWIKSLAKRYDWDYLIGSVHYIGENWSFDHLSFDTWDGKT